MFATITPGKQEAANTTTLKTLRIKSGLREIQRAIKRLWRSSSTSVGRRMSTSICASGKAWRHDILKEI